MYRIFCSCTAFSGMSGKTHGVLLNCASFTANHSLEQRPQTEGFFSAIFTKFIKVFVEKVRKSRRFEDDPTSGSDSKRCMHSVFHFFKTLLFDELSK